ncbi:gluconate:H+ symporter [Rhodohalobacter sp. 614A]|uniref:gluconate:H+ symporter n=1 Tax=Rhodohalobacter sp. 614A TaxID=2908649 RepID=UPI001F35DCE7|nr:gluconate:H+ symporter [Rhodohalobacter sp. 614A]
MEFLPAIIGIVVLVLLVTWLKLDAFISFMLVCLLVGVMGGLSIADTVDAIERGIGNTLGGLVIILGFGAMLGKLVAESGAANKITNSLVSKFGRERIQIALIITGFIVGIPMFYTVGFVILVPLVIAIAYNTKLPLLYVGLPMLASLSVTHGFLPPHPAPTAIADVYRADLGLTLIYGILAGIPAILTAKFALKKTMMRIQPELNREYIVEENHDYPVPSLGICLLIALMPVVFIGGASLLQALIGESRVLTALGNPSLAMLLSVLAGIYFLGIRTGRKMKEVMSYLSSAIASIAVVLLIIAGAGAFKEVMVSTNISEALGQALGNLGMSPIVLAWLIAAIIRVSVGSATVAALTAASIMAPMIGNTTVAPELLVLATGAGSIFFSHINDGGFWLFKEYFNVSIKETLLSWTLMETIVSVVGLLAVLLINFIV